MALDKSDAFTLGGLDRARMDGTILVAMRGEITGLNDEGVYSINRDGVITATNGGSSSDLTMGFGAGLITASNYRQTGTGGSGMEGSVITMDFTFGDSIETDKDQGVIELISVIGNAGWVLDNATVVDPAPAPMGLTRISGNTVSFAIGVPYEQEQGSQENINSSSTLYFDIIGIAKGRIVGV